MSGSHRNNTLKTPLYGNCHVQNPDGVHIFNCGEKKARWYLKRNLAVVIEQNPFTIRLTFIPHGNGHANDDFYLQERDNICVCCGSSAELTKHHVVPFMYRKFFTENLKDHTSYDILPLCYECHENYEEHAQQFKRELAIEYAAPKTEIKTLDVELKNVCMAASALLLHKTSIPLVRQEYLMEVLRKYYGREVVETELQEIANIRYNVDRPEYKPEGQVVVERLEDIEVFVKRWRRHFLLTLKPEYMPQHWTPDRPIL